MEDRSLHHNSNTRFNDITIVLRRYLVHQLLTNYTVLLITLICP